MLDFDYKLFSTGSSLLVERSDKASTLTKSKDSSKFVNPKWRKVIAQRRAHKRLDRQYRKLDYWNANNTSSVEG